MKPPKKKPSPKKPVFCTDCEYYVPSKYTTEPYVYVLNYERCSYPDNRHTDYLGNEYDIKYPSSLNTNTDCKWHKSIDQKQRELDDLKKELKKELDELKEEHAKVVKELKECYNMAFWGRLLFLFRGY